jgi:hypothetical protein
MRALLLLTLNHTPDGGLVKMKHVSELNLQYLNKGIYNIQDVLISVCE